MPTPTITHINTTTESNTPAGAGGLLSSLVVAVPSGTQNGDVMIACVGMAESDTLTAPGGWTQVGSTLSNATQNLESSIWYKVASSEPANYTWTIGTTNIWDVSQSTFRGVNTTTPVHTSNSANTTATTNPLTGPNVTTTIYTNILTFQATRENDTTERTTTAPGTETELADWGLDGGTTCRNAHLYFRATKDANGTVAGAAITISATTNVTARHQWTVALNPADPTDPDTGTGTEGAESIVGTVTSSDTNTSVTEGASVSVPLSGGNDTGTGTEGGSPTIVAVTEYLIHDDFDRADETSLTISSSGHDWTEH